MVNELRTVHKLWAITGLGPYNRHRQHQRWQRVYLCLLIVINLMLAGYAFTCIPFDDIIFVSGLVSRLLYINQTIAFTTNMLEIMLNFRQHFRFLTKSNRIKTLLCRELAATIHWQQFHRQLIWRASFYIAIVYGGLGIGVYVITTEYYAGYYGYALLLVCILRMRCLQMTLYVDYTGLYLRTLNRKLHALVNCKVAKQRSFLDVNYKRLESLEYLQAAKKIYNEIFEFAGIFGDLCGWSLLSLCVTIFLDLMINTYWTILTWERYYIYNYVYITLSTVVALLVIIFMFCSTCECTKQECIRTGRCMQRLLTTPRQQDLNARIYNDLVREFIIQVMQHPIQIEIKGFFNVDMELLMGTSAAMLTYLVILMQFRSTKTKMETPL